MSYRGCLGHGLCLRKGAGCRRVEAKAMPHARSDSDASAWLVSSAEAIANGALTVSGHRQGRSPPKALQVDACPHYMWFTHADAPQPRVL